MKPDDGLGTRTEDLDDRRVIESELAVAFGNKAEGRAGIDEGVYRDRLDQEPVTLDVLMTVIYKLESGRFPKLEGFSGALRLWDRIWVKFDDFGCLRISNEPEGLCESVRPVGRDDNANLEKPLNEPDGEDPVPVFVDSLMLGDATCKDEKAEDCFGLLFFGGLELRLNAGVYFECVFEAFGGCFELCFELDSGKPVLVARIETVENHSLLAFEEPEIGAKADV